MNKTKTRKQRRRLNDNEVMSAWGLYLEGKSLRDLSEVFDVSIYHLHCRLKEIIGPDFAKKKNKRTIYRCIEKDYLEGNTGSLTARQKQEVREWLDNLTPQQRSSPVVYLSNKDEYNLRSRECCFNYDLRWIADTIYLGETDD